MKYIIFILMLLLMAAPVAAVTYREEYYELGNLITMDTVSLKNEWDRNYAPAETAYTNEVIAIELRRQTILLEKQNELLEEQNMLLRNLTNARLVGYYEQTMYAPSGYKVTT